MDYRDTGSRIHFGSLFRPSRQAFGGLGVQTVRMSETNERWVAHDEGCVVREIEA